LLISFSPNIDDWQREVIWSRLADLCWYGPVWLRHDISRAVYTHYRVGEFSPEKAIEILTKEFPHVGFVLTNSLVRTELWP
jgi:hypothetical protein